MKKLIVVVALALSPALARAQPATPHLAELTVTASNPSGGCSVGRLWWNTVTQHLWVCEFTSWADATAAAGVSFPLLGPAGSSTAPTFSFSGDSNTGVYQEAGDELGLATGGVLRLAIGTTAFTGTLPWLGPNGSAAAPTFSFSSDSDTGVYRLSTDTLGFSTGGTERFRMTTTQLLAALGTGSSSAPNFSSSFNTDTGIFVQHAIDDVQIVTGGAARLEVSNTTVATVGTVQFINSVSANSAATPGYTFPTGLTTGWYSVTAGEVNLSISGAQKFIFNSLGLKIPEGSATGRFVEPGGTSSLNTLTVGNVGTGEDTLHTFSISANTLSTNGDTMVLTTAGTFAATANNKQVRVKFGATTIFDTGLLATTAATDWRVECEVFRTGSATQKASCTWLSDDTVLEQDVDYSAPTETLTGAVTLVVTGEATANDDIQAQFSRLEWRPANS